MLYKERNFVLYQMTLENIIAKSQISIFYDHSHVDLLAIILLTHVLLGYLYNCSLQVGQGLI